MTIFFYSSPLGIMSLPTGGGWCFVWTKLPVGWKKSPAIYHSIGFAVSNYLRRLGVPCLLYIDNSLNWGIFTPTSPLAVILYIHFDAFGKQAANAASLIVLPSLVHLGYRIVAVSGSLA